MDFGKQILIKHLEFKNLRYYHKELIFLRKSILDSTFAFKNAQMVKIFSCALMLVLAKFQRISNTHIWINKYVVH